MSTNSNILIRIYLAEKREYRLMILLGISLLLLGSIFLSLSYQRSIVLLILGLGLLITGAKLLFDRLPAYRRDSFPLSQCLREQPGQIVWVYSMVTQRMPFGFEVNQSGIMYFKRVDRKDYSLALPSAELKQISEQLNAILPQATFGYTAEREQWYLAHPMMLYQEENRGTSTRERGE